MVKRFSKRNIVTVILLTAVLATLCSGCMVRPRAERTDNGEKLFRLGFSGKGGVLNPYGTDTDAGAMALALLYDTLFEKNTSTGEYTKSLCSGFSVTNNESGGRRWEITIRDDAYWSDGKPVTASDVEFSIQSQSLFSSLYSAEIEQLLDAVGISVTDDRNLMFVTWGVDNEVYSLLSRLPVLPEHIWNEPDYMQIGPQGLPYDALTASEKLGSIQPTEENMVSSGMYLYNGSDTSVWHFLRNEKRETVNPDAAAVDFVFGLGDPARALTEGTVDGVYNGFSTTLQYWNDHTGAYYAESISPCQILVEINQFPEGNKALQDTEVRRALSLALQRENILTIAFDGGIATNSFLLPASAETEPVEDGKSAASVMAGAGYSDAIPLKLELLYSTEDPCWAYAAGEIKKDLGEIGVDLTLTGASATEIARRRDTRTYELLLTGYKVSDDERFALLPYYWNGEHNAYTRFDGNGSRIYAGWNECGYSSDKFDEVYEELLSPQKFTQRQEYGQMLDNLLQGDTAGIVIGYLYLYQACSSTWLGGTAETGTGAFYSVNNLRSYLRQIHAA